MTVENIPLSISMKKYCPARVEGVEYVMQHTCNINPFDCLLECLNVLKESDLIAQLI